MARSSVSSAASRASVSVFSVSRRRRRSRSIARLRAVVVIHAPGLAGMPRCGQVSSALMNASWTASSARSKSPGHPDQRRDRPALFLAEQAIDGVVGGVRPAPGSRASVNDLGGSVGSVASGVSSRP